ncbi:MAG: segregation/condensation protein A [Desulfarculaceae bacterium]|nr:segregation/condensation protein A [Desulfarculaceae bacterium]MCF8073310.1 segregation/condensation protein A [Desulfarculaceae bacterium]MCF8100906.1 segregation/condensation protein A [Desulfarculaceae bacterium]MCF8116638.1 segregation/condensation protein A [Desulfarculaceae bacterium]
MDVALKLEIFEGPLDLLLHLIRKNEVDIYDIPVALITHQYLEYLDLMRDLSIGVAGDFLVMAATLLHIKSRMLLPSYDSSEDEQEEDPRVDLVERLKEHMRIKAAADKLGERDWLDRDVFARGGGHKEVEKVRAGQEEVIEAGVFELIEAFRQLMNRRHEQLVLELPKDRMSLEDRISQLLELLRRRQTMTFEEFFADARTRPRLVVTFLALLELTRLGLIRLYQDRMAGQANQPPQWGVLRVYFQVSAEGQENEA